MENEISNSSSTSPFSDLEQELNKLLPLSANRCIYRVPKRLRCVNEKAYTPQIVSIGPLHHGQKSLAAMEEHKIRFVRDYLARPDVGFGLDHFINIIKEKEEQLRGCYAERIGLSSDEFVRIVLVDALFIIELFLRALLPNESAMNYESNYIFDNPYMLTDIINDLVLLENQLPFFILDQLFCENIGGMRLTMTRLSKIFFYDTQDNERTIIFPESNSFSMINHFVDFFIKLEVPSEPEDDEQGKTSSRKLPITTMLNRFRVELKVRSKNVQIAGLNQFGVESKVSSRNLPTATELHQFGVEFKVREGKELFDIRFSNGVLEIPKLVVFDTTELKLRNLIAFEQCHCENRYASDYAVLMSFLVHTCEDVEVLVKYRIIENRIGDNNRVAAMMYKLGDGVMRSKDFTFAVIFKQLNNHCEIPWNKHKANLKQNYFDSPWTTLSVIAASFIIILTFIQTVCSVMSTVQG